MDKRQHEAASQFTQDIETTTVSVGSGIGLRLTNHKLLYGSNPHMLKVPESSCISQCFNDQFCQAVTYVPRHSTCSFHNGQTKLIPVEESKNNPRVIIFPS